MLLLFTVGHRFAAHNLKPETNRQPETKTNKLSLASRVPANVVFLVVLLLQHFGLLYSVLLQLLGLLYIYMLYRKRNNDLLVGHFALKRSPIVRKCKELKVRLLRRKKRYSMVLLTFLRAPNRSSTIPMGFQHGRALMYALHHDSQ